jgi:hypothetical protein
MLRPRLLDRIADGDERVPAALIVLGFEPVEPGDRCAEIGDRQLVPIAVRVPFVCAIGGVVSSSGKAIRSAFWFGSFMSTIVSVPTTHSLPATAAPLQQHWSSRIARAIGSVLIFAALLCASQPASAHFLQQGPKLVGTGFLNASQIYLKFLRDHTSLAVG